MKKRLFIVSAIVLVLSVLPAMDSAAQGWWWGTTTTSSAGTTTTSSGGGGNTIIVRARGTAGSEQIRVEVNGSTVQTFTLSTSLSNYTASTNNTGAINVRFINDGTDRDVFIDYIDKMSHFFKCENAFGWNLIFHSKKRLIRLRCGTRLTNIFD